MDTLMISGNQGLGSWPARRARMSRTAVALRAGERELTYVELADRVARLASGLRRLGVGRGDRVGYLGVNDISTFEVLFACGLLGAVFVPLNTRLAPAELGYLLRDSGAQVLVVGHDVEPTAKALLQEEIPVQHVLTVGASAEDGAGTASHLETVLADSEPLPAAASVVLDDPAVLLYTSGTTGHPKAAVLTHGNLTWNTINQLAHFDLTSDERALCISPLFHAVGLGIVTLPTLFKGGSVEVIPRFDAGTVLATIQQHRITSFSAVPTMLQFMTEHPDWADTDLSSLRNVNYGGSAATERVIRAWLDRGVRLLQGYGMTEASPGVYMALHDGATEHPDSVGVPHFFTDVALLGDTGSVLPVEPGVEPRELLIRGPNVFAGYWGKPEATAESTVADGWFRTGDVLRAGDDSWVYVVDRVKDMIISGGENIYPAEVEAVITAIDGVRSTAVVALPDEQWGEVGVAFIELAPGASVSEDDVRAHLNGRLARFKIPKYMYFNEQLPRNATGKIKRVELRHRARSITDPEPTSERLPDGEPPGSGANTKENQ
jgi:fatty-acyl-CoA synthase